MLIHSIEFENYATGQKIQKLNFDELNLLVGVSGAGKTQILKTLSTYIAVASGHSLIDVHIPWAGHFKIDFTIHNYSQSGDWVSKNARWEIATDPAKSLQGKSAYEISSEVLLVDDKKIIERDSKSMRIDGQNAPLIDSKKSAIKIFKTPLEIDLTYANFFTTVLYYHQLNPLDSVSQKNFEALKDSLRKSSIANETVLKLYLHYHPVTAQIGLAKALDEDLFEKFLADLQDIFPSIEDVKIDILSGSDRLALFIKEHGKWIPKEDVSSGILKSICILSSVNFSPPNTLILLDELENSLGLNCLDGVTDFIINASEEGRDQFILTSHHPYIINHIPTKDWRIVSQNNGVISSKSAAEAGIDTLYNRQDQFFQLINYMMRADG